MQNLNAFGVVELDSQEMVDVTGGEGFWYRVGQAVANTVEAVVEAYDCAVDAYNDSRG